MRLLLEYHSLSDLRSHLQEHDAHGAMRICFGDAAPDARQYERWETLVVIGEERGTALLELLQVLPDRSWVVRLVERGDLAHRVTDVPPAAAPNAPVAWLLPTEQPASADPPTDEPAAVSIEDPADLEEGDPAAPGDDDEGGAAGGTAARGLTTWSIEKLQANWDTLSISDKIRVARHGNKPARFHVLKGLDKTLHGQLLSNPRISPEEVAIMAAMPNLDPAVLRRIATSPEWLRQNAIVRSLICNPKLPLPQVVPLIKILPPDELRRISKSGNVRQVVKQEIIKRLDRG